VYLVCSHLLWSDAGYRILRAIDEGKITPDPKGVVHIPPSMNLGSIRIAFITKLSDGGSVVVVPAWRGKGSNLSGMLYSNRPLTKADFGEPIYNRPHIMVMIGDRIQAEFGKPVEVYIDRVDSPTRYAVSRGDD
jgi:hypothetical protein